MKLIGMLDSPFVRRVAISLQLLELPFEHQSVSVFSGFDRFHEINPVVKAPTLVCDDGTILMDSTLILEYAEGLSSRSLMPMEPQARLAAWRRVGLALAACEKSVQVVYERQLRPARNVYQPWLDRIGGQLLAAFDALEKELEVPQSLRGDTIDQSLLSTAVAWHFSRQVVPDIVPGGPYPRLDKLSRQAEALDAFRAAPFGDGVYPVSK
ncbi:glutathione S-transferase [Chromobacterium sinusclupearum]|uniref:Glutathione S-transferase n=1 Tax=Chromobacterium sinusclupearum TaxID=2077146 RepID=A0A2K4MUH1_9NEIS|nr:MULTISPECIES: glutathione S-transferase family protein [Chromobacterium]POB00426.1 glutathione S-transferase [Chromobacterium sinusclupearum]